MPESRSPAPMDLATEGPLASVVLPTYNEKDNIVPLIRQIRAALEETTHEILVVDDDSPDGTAEVVRSTFGSDAEVRVFVRSSDPSLGKSIRKGIEEARGAVVILMDTDFNHQPSYLPFMLRAIEHYDCVMASRFLYGGQMDSRRRHLLSWAFNVFVRTVTIGQISDNLYGFAAIRRSALETLDHDPIFHGYGDYFIRLLFYLQRRNAQILQFPAVNGRRLAGHGNRRFFWVFRKYFAATLQLAWKERPSIREGVRRLMDRMAPRGASPLRSMPGPDQGRRFGLRGTPPRS